jgi:polynucleotide 5'-hydroxyl-kinase GRC3/NOL9
MTESNDDALKRPIVPEIVPDEWVRQIEDASKSASVTMVCGKPSSGKSIFSRRLLNRYLTGLGKMAAPLPSVYYLDLDASKPTYSPHGQIALVLVREVDLAPPFLNASTPPSSPKSNEIIRSFPLPTGAFSNYDDYFVSCLDEFIRIYAQLSLRNPGIPLIMDTPGWLFSSRFDLLLRSISRVKPQRLICFSAPHFMDDEDGLRQAALSHAARRERTMVQEVSAQTVLTTCSHTDQQLRNMQMLSYFHCGGLTKSKHLQGPFTVKPLSSHTPWEFCYEDTDEIDQSFLSFLMLEESADPDQIPAMLNGSVIQIVQRDENLDEESATLSRTERHQIPYFEYDPDSLLKYLHPSTSRLLCTGILRGWDFKNRIAQLLIPKSHESLVRDLDTKKTILVFGCCEYPEWAYTEDAYYVLANAATSRHAADGMVASDSIAMPSWVAPAATSDQMGYLNVPRRVRKFQQ